jgi:xanthine dehydrogenase/oxidase
MKDMEIAFQGNLCRCTGYRPIIEGFRTFTQEYQQCPMGDKCCKNQKAPQNGVEVSDKLFEPSEFTPYDASQEPIFPPELKLSSMLDDEALVFVGPRVTWYRPKTLADLLHLKKQYENTKIIVGNTEVGVEIKFKNLHYPVMASPSLVPQLTSIERTGDGLRVGSAVTLAALDAALRAEIKELPPHETRLYQAIVDMLHWFAGKQIRNAASVGGNIMTGSPISDLNPIFTAAGVE